jgi:hypothetical protein
MPQFRVLVHGENFVLLHGVRGEDPHAIRMGFFTNRFIDSEGDYPGLGAISKCFTEIKSILSPVNEDAEEDHPFLAIQQIWPVDSPLCDEDQGYVQGIFLYPEDKEAHHQWVIANFKSASKPHQGKQYRKIERPEELDDDLAHSEQPSEQVEGQNDAAA